MIRIQIGRARALVFSVLVLAGPQAGVQAVEATTATGDKDYNRGSLNPNRR